MSRQLPLLLACLFSFGAGTAASAEADDFRWGLVAYHVNFPGYQLEASDLELIAENGIEWIRIDFAWGQIEPERDAEFQWAYFDAVVAAARANGLQIAGTIGNGYNTPVRPVAPSWSRGLRPNVYIEELGEYADAVVARYADDVDLWGLENEVHIAPLHVALGWRNPQFFTPVTQLRIVKRLDEAADAFDPTAGTVLTAAPFFFWRPFLRTAARLFDYDYAGVYQYVSGPDPDNQAAFDQQVADVVGKAEEASGKPVMIFETGFTTAEGSPEDQANYVQTMSTAARRAGAEGIFFYQLLDNTDEVLPREEQFGLLNADRTPKPAWTRYGEVIAGTTADR